VLNWNRQFSYSRFPFPPVPARIQIYSRMSQASGNKLTGMLSGAFLSRACSLGHTLPYIARSGAGTSVHKLSGESMSIVGDMGLAVFVLLFGRGLSLKVCGQLVHDTSPT
jgi:hypothetical protein